MFRINHNILSINAQTNLFRTSNEMGKAMERLSTGLRINRAADDAAGLTISETMRSQIAGARQANQNISQAITLLQVADGGLDQIGSMLIRLKELATQAADDTLNTSNRSGISAEAQALITEIERIAESTAFNGVQLINSGGGSVGLTFYIGDGTAPYLSTAGLAVHTAGLAVRGVEFLPSGLGSIGGSPVNITVADFMTRASAEGLVSVADTAVYTLVSIRTELGAFQNRMERAQANIQTMVENTQNAESVVRDADFAAEASAYTRAQILVQSGASILAQANTLPFTALTLLQQ
jgi:flagellin